MIMPMLVFIVLMCVDGNIGSSDGDDLTTAKRAAMIMPMLVFIVLMCIDGNIGSSDGDDVTTAKRTARRAITAKCNALIYSPISV